MAETHFGAAARVEGRSAGESYLDRRLGRAARSVGETRSGAVTRVAGRPADEAYFDTWLGRGAPSGAETHFGAAVRGEASSADSTYFDPWLRRGARSVGVHLCAALWTEARGTRVEPGGSPAMGQKTGQMVLVSPCLDAPTSA